MKRNETNVLKVNGGFVVEWPEQLAIKPLFDVKLSNTVMAYVYQTTSRVEEYDDGKKVMVNRDGYEIDIRSMNTGGYPRSLNNYHYRGNRHGTYSTLLEVKLALEDAAHQLRPKTKKVSIEEDYED